MLQIECPWCGPREEVEFHYGGPAYIQYPGSPGAVDDETWARFLYFRDNPAGLMSERWVHNAGCHQWLIAVRDTVTYQIESVLPASEVRL